MANAVSYMGLPLPEAENDEVGIGVIVLMKLMKGDGTIVYREMFHQDLHPVEMLGMVTTFGDTVRQRLMTDLRNPGED